jgi:hypothetical protein
MKNNAAGWILFALTWPMLVGWLWVLGMCLFRRAEWSTLRFQGAGVLTARRTERSDKGFSTTLGRGICYSREVYDDTVALDHPIERHEFVHIKQYEDDCVRAAIIGLITAGAAGNNWWLGLGVYVSSIFWLLPNYLTAVLRYGMKGIYRDTEHERSAYAQTDLIRTFHEGGKWVGWDEIRRVSRKDQVGKLG